MREPVQAVARRRRGRVPALCVNGHAYGSPSDVCAQLTGARLVLHVHAKRLAVVHLPPTLTSAQLALRNAEPWLALAGTAIQATQRAHHPLPARSLLDAIPGNAPPPGSHPATRRLLLKLILDKVNS
jgi:hypothetical protein